MEIENKPLTFVATVIELGGRKYFSFKGNTALILLKTLPCYMKENLGIDVVIKRNRSTIYADPLLDHLEKFLDDKKQNHLSVGKMKVRDRIRFIFPNHAIREPKRKEENLIHLAWFFEKFED
jgi:hypothetical protein